MLKVRSSQKVRSKPDIIHVTPPYQYVNMRGSRDHASFIAVSVYCSDSCLFQVTLMFMAISIGRLLPNVEVIKYFVPNLSVTVIANGGAKAVLLLL